MSIDTRDFSWSWWHFQGRSTMSFNTGTTNGINKRLNFAMVTARPFPIHGRNTGVLGTLSKQISNTGGGIYGRRGITRLAIDG